MNFEQALHFVKNGSKLRRRHWPKRVWIYKYLAPIPNAVPTIVVHHNSLEDMDWRPTSRDLLANDWETTDG